MMYLKEPAFFTSALIMAAVERRSRMERLFQGNQAARFLSNNNFFSVVDPDLGSDANLPPRSDL
jgi:hypothetical protein